MYADVALLLYATYPREAWSGAGATGRKEKEGKKEDVSINDDVEE